MTVTSEINKKIYAGDGSTAVFATVFGFVNAADVKVLLVDADNAETLQTLSSDYTLSGGSGSSGNVTMVTAPASGQKLVIYRDPPLTQETDYLENDPFLAETHEGALDKLTHIVQRTREIISRSLVLPESSSLNVVLPTPVADHILSWNATGTAITNKENVATVPLANRSAIVDPSINTDTSLGYDIGSLWYNISSKKLFACFDASDGAAIWKNLLAISGNLTFTNRDNSVLFGSSNNQIGITVNSLSGADSGALFLGAADVITSSRTAQAILYGREHVLWSGTAILTPLTPSTGTWSVPAIPVGTVRWDANAGPPVVLEGAVITRGRILVDSGHGLVSGTGTEIWACRSPQASVHALSNELVGVNMATINPINASYTTLIAEGASHVYAEMWCKTAGSVARQYFRNVSAGFSASYLEAGFPSTGNEYLAFITGGSEVARFMNNGDLALFGKTVSDFSIPGCELRSSGAKFTANSSAAVSINLTGANSDILDFFFNALQIGSIKRNGTNYIQIEYANSGSNIIDTAGVGSPEGVLVASVGSLYRRTDGGANTTIYIKESGIGNTGWVAK